jgi:2-polyprenyl-6-hydroxyphenyl methylase / 3-demethylubiquinone-9 3-methyltransferase
MSTSDLMNSINKKEIEKFSKIAEEWWNPNGKFKPLHNFNPIRIKYIKENIVKDFNIKSSDMPLKNIKILDIGCGGGLLSEPMCRLGASVVGIDASKKNIEVAKFHSKKNKLKINYKVASPETLKTKVKFDVILNMEIVEHVEDINFFIKESSNLLKKNGIMFIATLNKTLKSYAFAIIGAEYILKWLPIGTHDWEKFIKPNDLIDISKKNNLSLKKIDGMEFDLFNNIWKVSSDTSVNYVVKFIKN